MARKRNKRKSKSGLAPGTLLFTGVQKMTQVDINLIHYFEDYYEEKKLKSIAEVIQMKESFSGISWVNIDGLHDENTIEEVCSYLGIHKLTMEDILSIGQRPKIEEHTEYLHVVLKMFMLDSVDDTIDDEQLSFILKGNTLITFQERTGDVFDSVRKRIKEGKGFIRKRGADYLLYALLDSVVDNYFIILETFGEKLEDVEIALLENPDKNTLNKLHLLRRETLNLRRSVYPLREVVSRFEKIEEPFINPDIKVFIRDLYDHTIQVIETIEVFRDMASGLLDLYMNSVSNKMNEIMKVLTIMASIFIPLTFIAGVYGMNFENMPELTYKYGYYVVWIVMILLIIGMLFYFKKKKWL
ncbi:MAG: magnesium and cobalt transport protein CorA [Flavobacteriaceae bacterium CG_4_8_14_3_um_filter_34_10]|nr:magnesium/cobalt transporter CorA [Flavobacteriia bacterium]OIP52329.1 MAG: magnesium and cobalt transport protein CorA [Flavobacteriaceae bacterium CG2_30_34_30]PIQ17782.1 MAG: magnesium and cobalt transport protein CorA [Flavobacteriaceae bacterium CG18_big_fil_WC_8_21_14_2_50_34_36]PIV50159.1 MAG: magnesium and cobalt transport protein CorA [Flavobacteriaceae bacterium CG02_land_8_20_14_3_00_34_13]PIX08564.1 MAG: magnesium and cobalt transport protein CorA [Flavobacteriaceae bacterium CG_